MINIEKAKEYLKKYQKLNSLGFVGRFLSEEKKEFEESRQENETIFEWCIRKALENLEA